MHRSFQSTFIIFKDAELSHWEILNNDLVRQYSKKYDMYPDHPCVICNAVFDKNYIWCESCGPLSVYCQDCAEVVHRTMNFHTAVEITVL